jgi:serine O-acetyltransferase
MLRLLREDFARHGSTLRSPSFWLFANYSFGRWVMGLPKPARRAGSSVYGALLTLSDFVLGAELHRETQLGEGVHIIHVDGVRIAPEAVIGDRVGIMHDVTIGTTPDRRGAPVIGHDVFIGAGAKILGPVLVGDRARIAANSLVISDVPPDTTAIGVPARILRYTGRNSSVLPTPAGAFEAAAAQSDT